MFKAKSRRKDRYSETLKTVSPDKIHRLYHDPYSTLCGTYDFSKDDKIPGGYFLMKIAFIVLSFLLFIFSRLQQLSLLVSVLIYLSSVFILLIPIISGYTNSLLNGFVFTDKLTVIVSTFFFIHLNLYSELILFLSVFTLSDTIELYLYRRINIDIPDSFRLDISLPSVRFIQRKEKHSISKGDKAHFSNGEKCPADAVLISGEAVCSFPVCAAKESSFLLKEGDRICSGTEILSGEIDVEFNSDVRDGFLYKLKENALKQAASPSSFQILTKIISEAIHLIPLIIMLLVSLGVLRLSSLENTVSLAIIVSFALFDNAYHCSLNALYSLRIKNLTDNGVSVARKDVLTKFDIAPICVVSDDLLLNLISSDGVSFALNASDPDSISNVLSIVETLSQNRDIKLLTPLEKYFRSFPVEQIALSNVRSGISDIAFTSDEISCVYANDKFTLKRSYPSVFDPDNIPSFSLHITIDIIKNDILIGSIMYDFSKTEELFKDSYTAEQNMFILESPFTAFKDSYFAHFKDLLGDKFKIIYIAEDIGPLTLDISEDKILFLANANMSPDKIGNADISFTGRSFKAFDLFFKENEALRASVVFLTLLHITSSALTLLLSVFTFSRYILLMLLLMKTLAIDLYTLMLKKASL